MRQTRVVVSNDTIPGLLSAAAARDPHGIWLRTDEGTLTFAGAAAQVARLAERLAEAGVRRGDLVVVTARTTPPYLLCWLALAALGAVTVPTDPKSTADELAGLLAQVQPRVVVTDAALRARGGRPRPASTQPRARHRRPARRLARRAATAAEVRWPDEVDPDDVAVLIPTSGTTGRSKLVMQTHRAYALAGEGFPYWMELTATTG